MSIRLKNKAATGKSSLRVRYVEFMDIDIDEVRKTVLIVQVNERVKGSFNLKILMDRKKTQVGDRDGVSIVSNKLALQEFAD